ncbi:hypothetical protein EK21DRAFT_60960 [Setomelanomma holmii]|uniref:Uncharacterized protein n=1 Tax=Setomelanomma holmii TaxID=210430 RepID=A0A9P4HEU1_9PLEO|nr:hypothetical protein EK21DRAFT_60960 [Setomelanomma holmii]
MSSRSFKRFTLRAKHSMSGLNPLCDGDDPTHVPVIVSPVKLKENDTPDLQDFGSLKSCTDSTCSEVHPASPAKNTPSRRKRLMGSLRSMGSIRSMRSPTQKENEQTGPTNALHEPQSPCTPARELRPSLALDFQQSPEGRPMFDLWRRDSAASSLHGFSCAVNWPWNCLLEPYPKRPPHFRWLWRGTSVSSPA